MPRLPRLRQGKMPLSQRFVRVKLPTTNEVKKMKKTPMVYPQSPLPYDFSALAPFIDARTMKIHYGRHHKTYAEKLDAAVKKFAEALPIIPICAPPPSRENPITAAKKPEMAYFIGGSTEKNLPETLEELLAGMDDLPEALRAAVRSSGGGHFNHEFFWKCLAPAGTSKPGPTGAFANVIDKDFGSLDNFKAAFTAAAEGHFGSGWAWLVFAPNGKLVVATTPNQDSPVMPASVAGAAKGIPLLALDLWEHAYYLKYQNRRPKYVQAFWDYVNWDFVQANFDDIR
ncbi:MAG: superoxide dismutase [Opitutae bacterium]|nr:superoxide dismutase [Opitutae bacterium]